MTTNQTTSTTTPGSGNLLQQITTERSVTTDPARRAMLDRVDAELTWWKQRDLDTAVILRLAPAPTMACPTWCALDPGHGWDNYEDGRLIRWHERDLSPEGEDGCAQVSLQRIDELLLDTTTEQVSTASRVLVDVAGDGGGTPSLTSLQAREVASVILDAARLLAEATAAGDPLMGRSDEEWARRNAS